MLRPEAGEPNPIKEGDIVRLNGSNRDLEVLYVGLNRVLACSPNLTKPEVLALKWEAIDYVR